MTLYIFRCRARPRMYGATRFETASNLPADQCSGGWEFCERVELAPRETERFGADTAVLRRQVQKKGWYVWDELPARDSRRVAAANQPLSREHQPPPAAPRTAASNVVPGPMTTMTPPAAAAEAVPSRQVKAPAALDEAAPPAAAIPAARHHVVWFDIPVRDLDRALRFYSAVLGMPLKKEQAGPGVAIAVLPHAEGSIGGCLVQNMDAKPSESGPLLYLNTHGRLDEALDAVEMHGGKVLSPRQSIAPFGYRAIVLDSEGNRVALHSM